MGTAPFWENSYRSTTTGDTFAGGNPSEEFHELAGVLPKGARVLDIGCGDGRNALFLAAQGFDVTGVDISQAGVEKMLTLAKARELPIRGQVGDVRALAWGGALYDLIIAHGCLHLIERPRWRRLVEDIQRHTVPGGYNVLAVFLDTVPEPEDLRGLFVGLFHEGEVFTLYERLGWRITLRRSYTFHDEHPGGIRHTHAMDKLVAQKE